MGLYELPPALLVKPLLAASQGARPLALKLLHFAQILEKLEKRKRNKNINRLVVFPASRTFYVEVTPSLGFNSYF